LFIKCAREVIGKYYGIGSAAEFLDLTASTLNSRMKKLGREKKYDQTHQSSN
jgi:hypothetical protein